MPRADIEVDIDMENIEEGVYLWGALVTERTGGGASSSYSAFATWEPMTPAVEAANSLRFWSWLRDIRKDAEQAGLAFRAYCYNASAENTYLRRLGIAGGHFGRGHGIHQLRAMGRPAQGGRRPAHQRWQSRPQEGRADGGLHLAS